MSETAPPPSPPGCPSRRPPGVGALPAGTYDRVTVLVTGGGTGLGQAIAVEFARLGAASPCSAASRSTWTPGGKPSRPWAPGPRASQCDIREPEQIAAAFDAVEEELGLPAVLVNNAAANFPVPAEDMSPNAWRTVVDITLNGTFFCAREFARRHLAAGTPASIVNVGASYAWTGGRASPTRRRPRPASRTWSRRSRSSGAPTGSRSTGSCPACSPTRT